MKGDPSGNNALNVNGTLDALGTATQPIVFTSLNDNTVGGTTGTGSPEAGDWGGINVSGKGVPRRQVTSRTPSLTIPAPGSAWTGPRRP